MVAVKGNQVRRLCKQGLVPPRHSGRSGVCLINGERLGKVRPLSKENLLEVVNEEHLGRAV